MEDRSMAPADDRLLGILESQGYRELVTAHLFASGVALAPTIDDKHMLADHAREELGHFEVVSTLYERLGANGLYEKVAERARAVPSPASWLESAVAGYLVDRAAALQLTDYKRLADARLTTLVDDILEHEHEHQAAAETALVDQCRNNPSAARAAQAHVARWYEVALEVLDGAGGPDGARLAALFADSVRPTLTTCGLSLPSGAPSAA
jgi:1,2-phenylacetyl-CoA epoxidase catalytic subunit